MTTILLTIDVTAVVAAVSIADISTGVTLIDELLTVNQTSESLAEYRRRARDDENLGGFSLLEERILLKEGRLVVPDKALLRTRIVDKIYSYRTTTYLGRNKTKKLLSARY